MKPSSVISEPPKIQDAVISFGSSTGQMKADKPTVFLWPAQWTEEEARVGTKAINTASRKYAAITVGVMKTDLQLAQLWGASVARQCATTFSKVAPTSAETEIEESEIDFVDASTVAPEKMDSYKACLENQEARTQVKATRDDLRSQAGPSLGVILTTVDPDQSNVQNWKTVKSAKITIARTEDGATKVSVDVQGFLGGSKNQSSEKGNGRIFDVSYDAQTRMLRFSVPVITKEGAPTGEVYAFALERVANVFEYQKPGKDENGNDVAVLVEIAAFKGDVSVLQNGKTVRAGSAQFSGEWVP